MYQASVGFRTLIDGGSRGFFSAKILVNGIAMDENLIKSITYTHPVMSGLGFGNVAAGYMVISVVDAITSYENAELEVFIGLEVSGAIEWIPFGKFLVDTSPSNEGTITITAYDYIRKTDIAYSSVLTYPSTLQLVAEELAIITGTTIATTVYPDIVIPTALNVNTCRMAFSVIGQLMGKNVIANRNSEIEFRWFNSVPITIDANRHYAFEKNQNDFDLGSLACDVNGTIITAGISGQAFKFTNDYMTESQLAVILADTSITYRGATCSFLGDPTLDYGDILTIKDSAETIYSVPLMLNVFTFDGGCKNDIVSYADTNAQVEYGVGTDIVKKVMSIEKSIDGIKIDLLNEYATNTFVQTSIDLSAEGIKTEVSADVKAYAESIVGVYQIRITADKSIFDSASSTATLTCALIKLNEDITAITASKFFRWKRTSLDTVGDAVWYNAMHLGNVLNLTSADLSDSCTFSCQVIIPDLEYITDKLGNILVAKDGYRLQGLC